MKLALSTYIIFANANQLLLFMQRVAWTSGKCSPISAGRRPSRDAERGEQSEEPEERLKERLDDLC